MIIPGIILTILGGMAFGYALFRTIWLWKILRSIDDKPEVAKEGFEEENSKHTEKIDFQESYTKGRALLKAYAITTAISFIVLIGGIAMIIWEVTK